MIAVFPNFPLRPAEVEVDFAEERSAALAAGFDVRLYSHEAVVAGDLARAVGACPPVDGGVAAVLRGWMLTDAQYGRLFAALADRGYRLVNDPDAYAEAHYLPRAYPKLAGETPESVWTDRPDVDEAWRLYQSLRGGDVVLKDHVKSAKHRWLEACFIPAGTDRARFDRILAAFVAERDRLFEKGFVLRRYVPLVTAGRDMRGHPAADEVRLFYADGELLVAPVAGQGPPVGRMERFGEIARSFRSRFMSVDVARTEAGDWVVIEVGDGGVSGLPVSMDYDAFFRALLGRLSAD
ncbi:MAG TPA: ATP-grasp domain-containing protein [Humisphaera sp.]